MNWFGFESTSTPLSIDVPEFEVWVSRASPGITTQSSWVPNPLSITGVPQFDGFELEPRLKVHDMLIGSNRGGASYASLSAATGQPISEQVNVENSDMILKGDRVIIKLGNKPIWSGYMTRGQLHIADEREGLLYHLDGPEWLWGGNQARGGALWPVYGQLRRKAEDDDQWASGIVPTTAFEQLMLVADVPCIFNPDGRKNMTVDDVKLSAQQLTTPILGRIFETPDRKVGGVDKAAFWDKFRAAKYLVQLYNYAFGNFTGVTNVDWTAAQTVIGLDKVIRHIDVNGMSLWHALHAVLGDEFGFYIDPRPATVEWKGFTLKFFSRSTGSAASLVLNPRDTTMSEADASVTRLEAVKAIDKTCTKVTVIGQAVRHVTLVYNGDQTPTLAAPAKKIALQHGWKKSEGKTSDFATANTVDEWGIECKGTTAQGQWRDRFTTKGIEFQKYRHVFRLFTWNEAGELFNAAGDPDTDKPAYGQAETAMASYAPNLTGICDASQFVSAAAYSASFEGQYSRRRRKPLDTPYLDLREDSWRRVRPTLYIAAVGEGVSTEPTTAKYIRVSESHYDVDPERCAIWITAPDLAKWRPFEQNPDVDEQKVEDMRTFATLLHTGKLRMILECSVEVDVGMVKTAQRTDGSGSPHLRETVVIGSRDYVRSLSYSGNVASPSGLTPAHVDQGADAQAMADQMRDVGHHEQMHASILASATWPEQSIGSMIFQTSGRVVNLSSSAGRGAQIVAIRIDPLGMKWEFLTESAALETRALDRMRIAARKRFHDRGRAAIRD